LPKQGKKRARRRWANPAFPNIPVASRRGNQQAQQGFKKSGGDEFCTVGEGPQPVRAGKLLSRDKELTPRLGKKRGVSHFAASKRRGGNTKKPQG